MLTHEQKPPESVDLEKLAKDRPDIAFDSSNGNETQSESIELEKILRDCENSRGYFVFASRLSKNKDKDGNFIIESTIKTDKFPGENLIDILPVFKKHIANCIVDIL